MVFSMFRAAAVRVGIAVVAFLPVMLAADVGVVYQFSLQQGLYRFIRAAGYAAVQLDARFFQGFARAAPDAAADQRIHLQAAQESGQGAVPLPVGIHDH